MYYYVNESREV